MELYAWNCLKGGWTEMLETKGQQTLPGFTSELGRIIHGDCLSVVSTLRDECIDLIITSPPYADNRKKSYGGVPIEHYVEWFLPISEQLKRVLKPEGSFILNIKERAISGERQTYVLELILEMKKQGWLWIEEYMWCKKNCYPGKWPNRFRDAWERCLHFTKQKKFKMFQEAVMVPMGNWAEKRLEKLSDTDRIRDESRSLSGFGKNVSHWLGKKYVYPTNVLHLATECANRSHSAVVPGLWQPAEIPGRLLHLSQLRIYEVLRETDVSVV
jgi:hypothetical protein